MDLSLNPQQTQPHNYKQSHSQNHPNVHSNQDQDQDQYHQSSAQLGGGAQLMNPVAAAAVAALSELAQFAVTSDIAHIHGPQLQRAQKPGGPYDPVSKPRHSPVPMCPEANPYYFKGRGRAGQYFRGRGQHSISGGKEPYRGSGQGQDYGRGGHRHSALQDPPPTTVRAPSDVVIAKTSAYFGVPTQDGTFQGTSQSTGKTPQICGMCRIECNSLQMLEQHMIGKQHKKNLQYLAQLKTVTEPSAEMSEKKNMSGTERVMQLENVQHSEENKVKENEAKIKTAGQKENEAAGDPRNVITEMSKPEAETPGVKISDNRKRGVDLECNVKEGQGGKQMKSETRGCPKEPHKPKVVIPLICDLCNVRCDTQEIFNRHLAGKKHLAKAKLFERHQAMFGPVDLQALYPPNPISQNFLQPHQANQKSFNDSHCPSIPPVNSN